MGTRTPDLLIANEMLYQLSYTPTSLLLPKGSKVSIITKEDKPLE